MQVNDILRRNEGCFTVMTRKH